jgi:hypothetical protein
MTTYSIKVSDFIAYELRVSNEGLSASDGKLYTGLLPLIEAKFESGTYQFNKDGFSELKSWAEYQADCNETSWYGDEAERLPEFRKFLRQLSSLA